MNDQAGRPDPAGAYTVADAIVSVLRAAGLNEIFGQSCPTQIFLAASRVGIRQIGYRAENAGAAMADGYARASGRIACVAAQNGAAAALLSAGLAESRAASIPVLALVQDVRRDQVGKNAFQEFDHPALFAATAKWLGRIDDSARAAEVTAEAIAAATSGRPGPAVLLIPADVLDEFVSPVAVAADGRFPASRVVADADAIEEVARLLAAAKRPLLVAGGGVHSSGAHAELALLQERFALPVATTMMGKGAVDETHPLSLGVVGGAMGPGSPARFMRAFIREADLVMFVGARTNDNGTASWTLFPRDAGFIHIDVDERETRRNYPALPLVGDAKATLQALIGSMTDLRPDGAAIGRRRAIYAAAIAQARASAQEDVERRMRAGDPLRPERVMRALRKTAPDNTLFISDASYSSLWMTQYLVAHRAGRGFLSPRGLAGIGWGYPMALGAAVASPDRAVAAIVGDGGFAHCWSELECAVRENISVKALVLNNAILGFQLHSELARFGAATEVCRMRRVDHAAIARAVGCPARTVARDDDLADALTEAFATPGPFLLDIAVDADAFPPIAGFEKAMKAPQAS